MTDEELMKAAFAEDKTVADILRHIFKLGQDNANERIEPLIAEIHDKVYAEGIAKGRAEMAKEVCELVDCDNTEECADCVFFDYRDDFGQLVTYCKLKEIASGKLKEQVNE